MRVLTVNPGSSSVKLAVVDDGVEVAHVDVDVAAGGPLTTLIGQWQPIDAVGVRFVHGGRRTEPVLLDTAEVTRLAELTPLAPLHQPLSLALAELAMKALPGKVFACFDTAFHTGLPEAAARYALPDRWVREHDLRRYGFHGLSCAYALRRTAEVLSADPDELQMVCCHVGAGVSVTAIRDGHSVDTSMGFTPLEGAMMATRSGSVDPGLLLYLLRSGVTDVAGLDDALDRGSGLAGMTGTSGDIREVLAARAAGDAAAALAIEVYLHRLRREIGAMIASLDRLDALVFTGGVAEHQPALLDELTTKLGIFGVHTATRVLVVAAREELEIAHAVTGGRRSLAVVTNGRSAGHLAASTVETN
jgi:acetate kinase